MARPKRVSVKGKGADLFFADLQPADDSELTPTGDPELPDITEAEDVDASATPGASASQNGASESKQESMHASTSTTKEPEPDELISSVILDAIWRDLAEQATVTNAFRYTHEELGQLTDAIYELGKEYGTRVTKQEVARLGLNAILTDYQIRGSESLLSTFIARRSDHEG